jgi:tetrahydromethanopterin S-methyltransferase subunit G
LANNDFKLMNERLTKLERQVNDAAVAKTLGRR